MTRPGIEPRSPGPLANTTQKVLISHKKNYILMSDSIFKFLFFFTFLFVCIAMEHPRGVMVKAMNHGTIRSEFELHSRYNVHFRTLRNTKVSVVQIVIGAFGAVTERLLKDLESLEVGGRVETFQTTGLIKTA